MKLSVLQKQLASKQIDVLVLVFPDPNASYLSQIETEHGYLFVWPEESQIVLSPLEPEPRQRSKGISVSRLSKSWKQDFTDRTISTVAFNKRALTVEGLDLLKELFPKARFSDFSSQLETLRIHKTDKEIRLISNACKIADSALQNLQEYFSLKRFPTELHIAEFLDSQMRLHGATASFPTIVASDIAAAVPHHKSSAKNRLRKGPLLLDFGARKSLYCSDMTRMRYIGSLSKTQKELFALLDEAQQAVLDAVTEEVNYSTLDTLARKKLGKYEKYFIHSLGHGIGIEVHEAPKVGRNSAGQVEKGHVFTNEPGIYLTKKWGMRLEDTVTLSRGKVKVLTKSSRAILRLG